MSGGDFISPGQISDGTQLEHRWQARTESCIWFMADLIKGCPALSSLHFRRAGAVRAEGSGNAYPLLGSVCLVTLRVGAKLHVYREADGDL